MIYVAILAIGILIAAFGLLQSAHEPFQRWRYSTKWYNPDRNRRADEKSTEYSAALLHMRIAGSRIALLGALVIIFSLSSLAVAVDVTTVLIHIGIFATSIGILYRYLNEWSTRLRSHVIRQARSRSWEVEKWEQPWIVRIYKAMVIIWVCTGALLISAVLIGPASIQ